MSMLGLGRMAFSLATTLLPQSHEDDWNTLILSGKMEAPPRFLEESPHGTQCDDCPPALQNRLGGPTATRGNPRRL